MVSKNKKSFPVFLLVNNLKEQSDSRSELSDSGVNGVSLIETYGAMQQIS